MVDYTLVIHWVFSIVAILIMTFRLVGRRIAKHVYNAGDWLTMGAIVCALTRLALIHVVLIWGTTNMSQKLRLQHHFTPEEIYQREIGSKFSIANRFFYNSYLWLQKLVLLDLYSRLIRDMPYSKLLIRAYLFVFFCTYVVVQVLNVSECNPIYLYWQVLPDPGECAKAQVQLLVLGILNIVTDFMLLVLPIPFVLGLTIPWKRKVQLLCLFTLGVFVILITAIRLPINSINKDSQDNRTLWATTELLTAAIVVNAPAIWGLWNKRRREKYSNSGGKTPGDSNRQEIPIETIGGGDGSSGNRRKVKPSAKVWSLSRTMMSDARDGERIELRSYAQIPDDREPASQSSNQHELAEQPGRGP